MRRKKKQVQLNTHYEHRAIIKDDNEPVVFKWHWPRGTFDKRMSALEVGMFVLPHMPHILPLLSGHSRIQKEFEAILILLITSPKEALDKLLPWIKPVIRTEDDDIIEMNLIATKSQLAGPTYFT